MNELIVMKKILNKLLENQSLTREEEYENRTEMKHGEGSEAERTDVEPD